MENQNCRKDSKQLCINADEKCQAARLICNKSCSLVLKRCIIIGSLIRVAAEPGCAQQPDKSKHTNAAANRSKPTVFCKVAYDRKNCQQRLPHGWQESLSAKLRKRTYRGKPIKEKTVQKYLTVVSAALCDAKRNEIIEKNPARMIELPDVEQKAQEIPTMEEMQKFLSPAAMKNRPFSFSAFSPSARECSAGNCVLCAGQPRS